MTITDVRVKLAADGVRAGAARAPGRLLAFCSITVDGCFVVRDLKLIRGEADPFVAMPSRKITARCGCGGKNPLRSRYCGECGAVRGDAADPGAAGSEARVRLYADIAHPITAGCRAELEAAVVDAYERELTLAARPGYVCRYDDVDLGEPPPGGAAAESARPSRPLRSAPGVTRRLDGGGDATDGPTGARRSGPPHAAVRGTAGGFGEGL